MPARGPFSRWIFEAFDVPERSLAISRILFCVSLLAFWFDPNNPRYLWTRNFPASFYAPPPGLGMFFSHQPAGWIMWLLFASVMTLTLAVLVGWNTRGCGLLLSAVLLVGNSFEYSFGKINHDILMILVVGTMSFSGWTARYRSTRVVAPSRRRQRAGRSRCWRSLSGSPCSLPDGQRPRVDGWTLPCYARRDNWSATTTRPSDPPSLATSC